MTIEKSFKESVVVNLNKPPDITSHQAGRKVQRISGPQRPVMQVPLTPLPRAYCLSV